jgi:hypothetical protein
LFFLPYSSCFLFVFSFFLLITETEIVKEREGERDESKRDREVERVSLRERDDVGESERDINRKRENERAGG